jgi:YjbE family integral membrane protein
MDLSDGPSWLIIPVQILFVDLLLGADNALVIALACRSLPPKDVGRAASIGIGLAIALRLVMTMVATTLLVIPLVKIVAALALTVIAMNMASGEALAATPRITRGGAAAGIWSAAAVIVVADAAMGLDNVVALAAIARGNFPLLAIGVALSLPVLGYGGMILTELLKRAPGLVAFGAALLGWIAGGMAISDALIAPWANANAPALVAIAPLLGAGFVFIYGRMAAKEARPAAAPARRIAPPPALAAPGPAAEPPPRPAAPAPKPPSAAPRRWGASVEDRVVIVGVIALALVAGAFLVFVAYIDAGP